MSADPRDLCVVADVKAALEPTITGTSRDPRIQTLITSASVQIMQELDRELTPKTSSATRRFKVGRGGLIRLNPYDLRSASSVSLNPESSSPTALVANTDYALEPVGTKTGSYQYLRLSALVPLNTSDYAVRFGTTLIDVTGAWGIWDTADVDPDVREGCVLTVRAWLRQNPGAYLATQGGQQGGGPVMTSAPQTWEIPKAAMCKLARFRRLPVY